MREKIVPVHEKELNNLCASMDRFEIKGAEKILQWIANYSEVVPQNVLLNAAFEKFDIWAVTKW